MPTRLQPNRGFTLIELVTTLLIVGILAVFVTSRLDFVSFFQQQGTYDKLKAGLEFARKAAVAKRRYVQVTVAGGTVSFLYDSNSPENVARNFAAGNLLTLPAADSDCGAGNAICSHTNAAIALAGGASPFTFDPQGGASAAISLSVTGAPNIAVEAVTGYVH